MSAGARAHAPFAGTRATLGRVARGRLALVLGAVALASCGSPPRVDPAALIKVPPRATTAGDELLALAPAGADVVVEVDLARLRDNEVVGPMVVRAAGLGLEGVELGLLAAGQADALLFCAYDVGTEQAAVLTLVRGPGAAAWGRALDDRLAALGPPALVDRVRAVQGGAAPALASDRALLSARTRAMPAAAEGAWLRAAARLSFDARVALAGLLDLDHVPTEISVWGDVADDLAVVVVLTGEDASDAARLARSLSGRREALAGQAWARRFFVHLLLPAVEITTDGAEVRVILLLGPRRLRRMMDQASRLLPETQP